MNNWIWLWFVLRTRYFCNFGFFSLWFFFWCSNYHLWCFDFFGSFFRFLSCNSYLFFFLTHLNSLLNHQCFFIFLLFSCCIMSLTFLNSFSHEFFLLSFIQLLGNSKCFFCISIHFFIFILFFGQIISNIFWCFRCCSFCYLCFSQFICFHL